MTPTATAAKLRALSNDGLWEAMRFFGECVTRNANNDVARSILGSIQDEHTYRRSAGNELRFDPVLGRTVCRQGIVI